MRIVIHQHYAPTGELLAEEVFHTEDVPWNQVTDPRDTTKTMKPLAYLALLNAQPAIRAAAGWHAPTAVQGAAATATKWDMIVKASKAQGADAALAAAGLNPTSAGAIL
jgi:hypothetical protein